MKKNIPLFVIFCCLLAFTAFHVKKWRCSEGRGEHCIASDGRGYYAYLPAVFIYHDLHFKFIYETEKKFENPELIGGFLADTHSGTLDKYFAGVAFLLTPFFLLAYAISPFTQYAADGYSDIFQGAVCAGSVFYFLIGLFFLRKTLKLFGFSERLSIFTALICGLGTNLFYYTVMEPSMSHVYSFAMISVFIYSVKQYSIASKTSHLIHAAISFGIIVLIRPPNGIILFSTPFIVWDVSNLKKIFFDLNRMKKHILIFFLIIICILSIQPTIWYLQIGNFFVWSYPGESFNFFKPEIINILFSYRKGLFIYTPLIFLSLFGLIVIYKRNRFAFITFLIFFFIVTFVLSSWWSWWYGGSFGLRAFIDFYPVLIIPFAFLMSGSTNYFIRIPLIAVTILITWMSYVQSYQYTFNIFSWDLMDKRHYWDVFMSMKRRYRGYEYIELNSSTVKRQVTFMNDFEDGENWGHPEKLTTAQAFSGTHSTFAGPDGWYSATFEKNISQIISEKNSVIRATCKAYLENHDADAQLVVSFENNGISYSWRTVFINEFIDKKNSWGEVVFEKRCPKIQSADDVIKIYVLSMKNKVYVDDFRIEFYEMKEK